MTHLLREVLGKNEETRLSADPFEAKRMDHAPPEGGTARPSPDRFEANRTDHAPAEAEQGGTSISGPFQANRTDHAPAEEDEGRGGKTLTRPP